MSMRTVTVLLPVRLMTSAVHRLCYHLQMLQQSVSGLSIIHTIRWRLSADGGIAGRALPES
jgi:hypothetical protein